MFLDVALSPTVVGHNNAFSVPKVLDNFVEHDGAEWIVEENENIPIRNFKFNGILTENLRRDAKPLQVILRDAAQFAGIFDADQLGKLMLRSNDQRAALSATHVDEGELFRIDSGILDRPFAMGWEAGLVANAVNEVFVAEIR